MQKYLVYVYTLICAGFFNLKVVLFIYLFFGMAI